MTVAPAQAAERMAEGLHASGYPRDRFGSAGPVSVQRSRKALRWVNRLPTAPDRASSARLGLRPSGRTGGSLCRRPLGCTGVFAARSANGTGGPEAGARCRWVLAWSPGGAPALGLHWTGTTPPPKERATVPRAWESPRFPVGSGAEGVEGQISAVIRTRSCRRGRAQYRGLPKPAFRRAQVPAWSSWPGRREPARGRGRARCHG